MQVRGLELSVLDTGAPDGGDPTPICFSHGLLWSKEMYGPQIEALSGRHRCVAWDHRGQGQSEVPSGRVATIDACTDDAAALIEQLHLGPVHFVGLSMGGFVGLRLAIRRPELIQSLVLIDTAADPEPASNVPKYRRLSWAARIFGVNGWLANQVMPILFGDSFLDDPDRAALRAEWRGRLMQNRRAVVKAVAGVIERASVESELDQIRCPVLQIHGEEDRAIVMERARSTSRRIPGCHFVTIPRAGHTSTIENPIAVTEAITAFLESQ